MNDGGTIRDVFNLEAETGMSFNQKQIMTDDRATGWWTIALIEGRSGGSVSGGTSGSDQRGYSKFYIKDESSSHHQLIVFDATHLFGGSNGIHVYNTSDYAIEVINGIRIKEGSTYDGALLQINVGNATNSIVVYIQDNYTNKGWQLIQAVVDASDPTTGSLGIKYSTAYASWSVVDTVTLSNGILKGGARFKNMQIDEIHNANDVAISIGSAGVIFNEDGHSINDFRIESDNQQYMFHLDSGADKVAIMGDGTPTSTLEINGSIGNTITVSSATGGSPDLILGEHNYVLFTQMGAADVDMPAAITGRTYHLTNMGAGIVTLDGHLSETFTIPGGTGLTFDIDPMNWITLVGGSGTWYLMQKGGLM
jgi:hypothetical protein